MTPALDRTGRGRLGVYFNVFAAAGQQPEAMVAILRDCAVVLRAAAELVDEGGGRFAVFFPAALDNAPPGDYELRVAASSAGRQAAERTGFAIAQ